jgi:hypothetical protein
MSKDTFLLRAKDWALLVAVISVLGFAWSVFAKVVTAQNRIDSHEVRISAIEPQIENFNQFRATYEAHFQDMISRLDRIERQTK